MIKTPLKTKENKENDSHMKEKSKQKYSLQAQKLHIIVMFLKR